MRSVSRDERIITSLENADYFALSKRERALIEYAKKLTSSPYEVSQADIEYLRASELDDVAILHACQIIAYFNFVNRLAHGLGVQLES